MKPAEFSVGDNVKHVSNCDVPALFPAGVGTVTSVIPWNTADGYSYQVTCKVTGNLLPVNFKATEIFKIAMLLIAFLFLPTALFAQDPMYDRVTKLENDVAALTVKIDKLYDAAMQVKANDPFVKSNRASGGCQCGCVTTGQCTCPNCDTPQLTPPKTQAVQAQYRMVCDGNQCHYMPLNSQPYQTYQTYQSFQGAFQGGGCANGSCGQGVGLFGRRRR